MDSDNPISSVTKLMVIKQLYIDAHIREQIPSFQPLLENIFVKQTQGFRNLNGISH